jgi:predicted Zn finger-like uncharacterized protein
VQSLCSQCGTKIAVDDAKIPDRAFQVKCPKCQTAVKFPGKPAPEAAAPAADPQVAIPATSEEMKVQMMAQLRRELSLGEGGASGARALVSVPDKALAGAATLTLTRQGYQVDTLDDGLEGARLMEQGLYELVVTSRAGGGPGKPETLYQRLSRLNPDARRRLFVVLVGDEFKTGEGTQAFTCLADLVVNSKDVPSADGVLRNTVAEKGRVYQAYIDARRRHESAGA